MTQPVTVVLGTRPEAIKLAGIIRVLGDRGRVIHTGQHYDASMWKNVLGDLAGVNVTDHIEVGGRSRGEQIGLATHELSRYFGSHPTRAVIVQGDTNSTLAGALAASANGTPLVHVEAGLRSHDRSMPEEINRILTDALADLCCAPLAANAAQLRREGVTDDRISITGNTLADAMGALLPGTAESKAILARHGVRPGAYVLATVHRAGNVDVESTLSALLRALGSLGRRTPVLFPMHPRTAQSVRRWGLEQSLAGLRVLDPLSPRDFVGLEAQAALLVSDSGGVQEEACLFRRPLLVVRDSTERPELLNGWCRLLGDDDPTESIELAWADAQQWADALATRQLPYATERVSDRIVAALDLRWP